MAADPKRELIEKINKMTLDELQDVYTTAKTTGRLISLFGIFLILFALIVGNPFTYVVCFGMVYILGHISVGADNTLNMIEERIEKLNPDK